MSEEQTTCSECSVTILCLTAQETGGLCMVCAREGRQTFEENRRKMREYEARQAAFRLSPVWRFWERLVESDFNSLSPDEKLYYAAGCLRGDVNNGGLHQYFFNSSGRSYEFAAEGLKRLGAGQTLAIVQEAKHAIFGDGPVSMDTQTLRLHSSLDDYALNAFLDELDRRFYRDPDELWERLEDFGVARGFYPQRWIDT